MKKIFYNLALILLLFSCKKESKCETWEYFETCAPKVPGIVGCGFTTPRNLRLCNDGLDGIYPGSTKIALDNAQVTITRHFIRKVD